MNIKSPADFKALQELLAGSGDTISKAMDEVGTVHFARFVFLSESQLAVITSYDGDFDVYIIAFTNFLGKIFDALLAHMSDAPPLPVEDNIKEFLAYIKANDRSFGQSFYSAYPTLTVRDILGLASGG